MNLLEELQKQRMKLSHVSEKLDMTITEASRHLQRLTDAKLIQKDVNPKRIAPTVAVFLGPIRSWIFLK
jgi:DNA-binding IclR family transcriptional regulator